MNDTDELGAMWVAAHLVWRSGEARCLPPSEMDQLRYRLAGAWVGYALASHKAGEVAEKSVEREARRLGLGKFSRG